MACGQMEDQQEQEQGPKWTMDLLLTRRLLTFEEWRAAYGYQLAPAQQEALERDGHLYGVVPASSLPVRHPDGTVEVTDELQSRLTELKDADLVTWFEGTWQLGLWNPNDPVHMENAEFFLHAKSGLGSTTQAMYGSDGGMAMCEASCDVVVNNPGGRKNFECHCYDIAIGTSVATDTKPQCTFTAQVTVSCSFTSACGTTNKVYVTVAGPSVGASASANGAASILDRTRGASFSSSLNISYNDDGNTKSFGHGLEFQLGSSVSGTTTTGSKSQIGVDAGVETKGTANVPIMLIDGSARVDANAAGDAASTWLYSPTHLTVSHSIEQSAGHSGSAMWQLNQIDNRVITRAATATSSGCACSVTTGLFTANVESKISVSVSATGSANTPSCSTGSGVYKCTMN